MLSVANRVYVTPEYAEEFEKRFQTRAQGGTLQQQPGFIRLQILRPISEAAPYVVHTLWHSRKDFDAWVGSEDFANAHRNPLPQEAYSQKGSMEMHDVTIDTNSL